MTRPSELPALTVVRFFAAISVVWFHYGRFVPMPHQLLNVTLSGYVWVTFFFMLSGFILVYVARDLEVPAGRREFYVRRVARIVPVYLLAWVLFAVCQLIDPAISIAFWLKTMAVFGGLGLVFAQSWVPGAAQYWNTPAWSLSCEALFYVCFPAVFLLVLRMNRRALWIALFSLSALSIFGVVAIDGLKASPLLAGTAFSTTWGKFLSFHPVVQMIVFLIGVMLGQLYVMGGRLRYAGWCLALSIASLAGLSLLESGDVRRDILLVPAFSLLIYSLACLPNLISGKAAVVGVLLGNASYGIYILQEPLWYLFCSATGRPRWGSTASPITLAEFLVLLVTACVLIYVLFERRVEKAIKSKFGRSRRATASALSQGAA
jgi:peptidoglycan/LPS O-acetylase OafA/YrhL